MHVVGVADDEDPVVFTGGNLLYGAVGHTDLITPQLTEELTRPQYRSARRLADRLSGDARIFPTHGFGSFCSSTAATQKESSTVAEEQSENMRSPPPTSRYSWTRS